MKFTRTMAAAAVAAAIPSMLCGQEAAAGARAQNVRNAYKIEAAVQDVQRLREQFDILVQNQDVLDTRLANLEKARGDAAGVQAQIDELRRAQESLREAISALSRAQQAQRKEIVDEISRKVEALYKSNPPPSAAPSGRGRATAAAGQPRAKTPATTDFYEHVIKSGQTLAMIAREYGCCTVQDIKDANPNINPAKLKIGQKILVPDMGASKKPKQKER